MFNLFGPKTLPYEVLTPQQVEQRIKESKPLVIDVRESYEYATGHIKGSKLIPLRGLASKVNALGSKDREIIVVCQSGGRSSHAAHQLSGLGFTKVSDMRGGMSGWSRSGLPVER